MERQLINRFMGKKYQGQEVSTPRFFSLPSPQYISETYGNHEAVEAEEKIHQTEFALQALTEEEQRIQHRFSEIDVEYSGALTDRQRELDEEIQTLTEALEELSEREKTFRVEIQSLQETIRKVLGDYAEKEKGKD